VQGGSSPDAPSVNEERHLMFLQPIYQKLLQKNTSRGFVSDIGSKTVEYAVTVR